jgi:hypothetical protein
LWKAATHGDVSEKFVLLLPAMVAQHMTNDWRQEYAKDHSEPEVEAMRAMQETVKKYTPAMARSSSCCCCRSWWRST